MYNNNCSVMERVNFVDIRNINVVSNVVPESRNERNTQNQVREQRKEVEREVNNPSNTENTRQINEMASKYEKVGDVYEKVSQYESAINSYQISYTLKPNPEVVEKVDNVTAKIVSEKLRESNR